MILGTDKVDLKSIIAYEDNGETRQLCCNCKHAVNKRWFIKRRLLVFTFYCCKGRRNATVKQAVMWDHDPFIDIGAMRESAGWCGGTCYEEKPKRY